MSKNVLHKALLTTRTLLKLKLLVAQEITAKQEMVAVFEKKSEFVGCDMFKQELTHLEEAQKELEEAEIINLTK